jgi:G:T-mismatch repair DNA endonuclease (very short patch repair protein)
MVKCFICKEEIKLRDSRHISKCVKLHNINYTKDKIKFEQISFNQDICITFDVIYDLYINQQWSLPDFKSKLNLPYGSTLFLLKYYNIPIRSISESRKTNRCKTKTEKTCIEKFGCKNPSSNPKIKSKRVNTFLEKYGVDNVRKSDWFKIWYKNYMQITYNVGSMPNRYGNMQKYWDLKSKDEKISHMQPAINAFKLWYSNLSEIDKIEYNSKKCKEFVEISSSKLESFIAEKLTLLEIPYTSQFWVNQRSYDFRISNTNLLIEVNGDFWHANPIIYEANDIMNFPGGTQTAKEKWENDISKIKNAEKYGYTVLTIWENDISVNKEIIESWLSDRIVDHVIENKINKED